MAAAQPGSPRLRRGLLPTWARGRRLPGPVITALAAAGRGPSSLAETRYRFNANGRGFPHTDHISHRFILA